MPCVWDRVHFRLVQPAEPCERKREPALGLGLGFHHGIGQGVAFETGNTDSTGGDVLAASFVPAIGTHYVQVAALVVLFLGDGDPADRTQLLGGLTLGIQRQSPIEHDIAERLSKGVQTEAVAHSSVVRNALLRRELAQVALDHDLLQQLNIIAGERLLRPFHHLGAHPAPPPATGLPDARSLAGETTVRPGSAPSRDRMSASRTGALAGARSRPVAIPPPSRSTADSQRRVAGVSEPT